MVREKSKDKEKTRAQARAERKAKLEADARLRFEREAREVKAQLEKKAIASPVMAEDGKTEEAESKPQIEILSISAATGTCECCGRKDVPKDKLVKIDSGQLFCPNCLTELRGLKIEDTTTV